MTEKTFIHILDSSLRDGSHALSHQYTAAQVSSVARGLDDAGVEMIEVSHGDGLGGSTVTYGFSKQSELELLQAASEVIKKSKLAILLLPGIGTKDDLKMAWTTVPRWRRLPLTLPKPILPNSTSGWRKKWAWKSSAC